MCAGALSLHASCELQGGSVLQPAVRVWLEVWPGSGGFVIVMVICLALCELNKNSTGLRWVY